MRGVLRLFGCHGNPCASLQRSAQLNLPRRGASSSSSSADGLPSTVDDDISEALLNAVHALGGGNAKNGPSAQPPVGGPTPPIAADRLGDAFGGDAALRRAKAAAPNQPGSYKLIDRLRDCRLQREWARALRLFDHATPDARRKWQPFHYATLLDTLNHAAGQVRRTSVVAPPSPSTSPLEAALRRIWKELSQAKTPPPLDARCLNLALRLASQLDVADVEKDISQRMTVDAVPVSAEVHRQRARHLAHKHNDWVGALKALTESTQSATATEPSRPHAAAALPIGPATGPRTTVLRIGDINKVAFSMTSVDEVAPLVRQVMLMHESDPNTYPRPNADTAAALVRSAGYHGDWQRAISTFDSLPETWGLPITSTPIWNALLNALIRARQGELADEAFRRMADQGIPHDEATVQQSLRRHELAGGNWFDACTYFASMRQLSPTVGTANNYTTLMRVLSQHGPQGASASDGHAAEHSNHVGVVKIMDMMRADGVDGHLVNNTRANVDLINAWSATRRPRSRRFS